MNGIQKTAILAVFCIPPRNKALDPSHPLLSSQSLSPHIITNNTHICYYPVTFMWRIGRLKGVVMPTVWRAFSTTAVPQCSSSAIILIFFPPISFLIHSFPGTIINPSYCAQLFSWRSHCQNGSKANVGIHHFFISH